MASADKGHLGVLRSLLKHQFDLTFTDFQTSRQNLVIIDLSIGSTETKYIKLNTKTQFFLITFDFCTHFKRENFFSPFVFLSPLSKCIKK